MFKSKHGEEIAEKLTKIANLLLLSLLWVIFSLPIVTLGAATSALYASVYHCLIGERTDLFKTFLRTFKHSFSQATVAWLFYVTIVGIFILNWFLIQQRLDASWLNQFSQVFLLILSIGLLPVLFLMLAYISRFRDPLKKIFLNCVMLLLLNFTKYLWLLVTLLVVGTFIWLIPISVVILPAYGSQLLEKKAEEIFIRYGAKVV
ncbi:YesL family protein [Enterococcus nangangensis]|uniref:YesL family protein n=1 Tax=Enterococcus nangangensis TaxID=2559926 RepID=UPI0010F6584C|nr:YesL family protein [Enterococcus nangangensis]